MKLVRQGDGWRIEGEGRERARIAYASQHDEQLVYSLTSTTTQSPSRPIEEIKSPL
jgi:hypothetical protein